MDAGFLFVLLAMFAFFYLLLIRPQRQQQRRQADMINALKPGDEVITAGGIYGDVTEVQDDRVSIEIAEDVEIEVAKRAIATVVPPEEGLEPVEAPEPETVPEPEPAKVVEDDAARR